MITALCCPTSAQQTNVQVNYLGANNTIVKVNANSRYLLMPIGEQAPETHINVLINGNIDQQINVRLAQSKIDYYVPFDLEKYKGKRIVLDISTGNDRTNVRDTREDVCWKKFKLSNTFDSANIEKYRPAFHHTYHVAGDTLHLRLFIDGSMVEGFINDGDAFSTRIFPLYENSTEMKLFADGSTACASAVVYKLNSAKVKMNF